MRIVFATILGLALTASLAACGGGGGDNDRGVPQTLIAFQNDGDMRIIDATDASSPEGRDLYTSNGMLIVGIGRVSGAIYNPVTDEIWLGMGGNSEQGGGLMAIDQSSGECTQVGTYTAAVPGLAISSGNRIFSHRGDSQGFYEFDNVSGAGTEVNPNTTGSAGNGVTFRGGVLYLATNEALYTVDQTTFEATLVANLSQIGFPTSLNGEIVAMATRPSDDEVFAIWRDGAGNSGGGAAYLVTVNVSTAAMTYIGTLPGSYDGLAWVPTSSLPEPAPF